MCQNLFQVNWHINASTDTSIASNDLVHAYQRLKVDMHWYDSLVTCGSIWQAWSSKLFTIKARILSTMHSHLHLLQQLSSEDAWIGYIQREEAVTKAKIQSFRSGATACPRRHHMKEKSIKTLLVHTAWSNQVKKHPLCIDNTTQQDACSVTRCFCFLGDLSEEYRSVWRSIPSV